MNEERVGEGVTGGIVLGGVCAAIIYAYFDSWLSYLTRPGSAPGLDASVVGTVLLIVFFILPFIAGYLWGEGGPALGTVTPIATGVAAAALVVPALEGRYSGLSAIGVMRTFAWVQWGNVAIIAVLGLLSGLGGMGTAAWVRQHRAPAAAATARPVQTPKVLRECPTCRASVEVGWNRCAYCGTILSGPGAQPEGVSQKLVRELERQRTLLERLKERFSMGDVSEKVFLELKGEYEERIRRLQSELESAQALRRKYGDAARLEEEKAQVRAVIGDLREESEGRAHPEKAFPVRRTARQESRSSAWLWLLPVLFGLFGGIAAWAVVRRVNRNLAGNMLLIGCLVSILYFLVLVWLL